MDVLTSTNKEKMERKKRKVSCCYFSDDLKVGNGYYFPNLTYYALIQQLKFETARTE